jgi:long-chain acyl-CoA synthetase
MRARDRGLDESAYSDAELVEQEDVRALFDDAITAYNREASAHEKIRAFRLLAEPFTVEDGTLTPTLKLRRSVITDRYTDRIDAMYERFRR